MPRVKQWSSADRERALQWVERRARINGRSGPDLVELSTIVEPEAVAERLRGLLPEAEWKRLLSALRQRKHASNSSKASAGEPTAAAACRQCAELRAELEKVRALVEHYRARASVEPVEVVEPTVSSSEHAIQRAAELRAAGQSFRQIAAALNAEGLPTRSGRGQWQPGSVEKALRGA